MCCCVFEHFGLVSYFGCLFVRCIRLFIRMLTCVDLHFCGIIGILELLGLPTGDLRHGRGWFQAVPVAKWYRGVAMPRLVSQKIAPIFPIFHVTQIDIPFRKLRLTSVLICTCAKHEKGTKGKSTYLGLVEMVINLLADNLICPYC